MSYRSNNPHGAGTSVPESSRYTGQGRHPAFAPRYTPYGQGAAAKRSRKRTTEQRAASVPSPEQLRPEEPVTLERLQAEPWPPLEPLPSPAPGHWFVRWVKPGVRMVGLHHDPVSDGALVCVPFSQLGQWLWADTGETVTPESLADGRALMRAP